LPLSKRPPDTSKSTMASDSFDERQFLLSTFPLLRLAEPTGNKPLDERIGDDANNCAEWKGQYTEDKGHCPLYPVQSSDGKRRASNENDDDLAENRDARN